MNTPCTAWTSPWSPCSVELDGKDAHLALAIKPISGFVDSKQDSQPASTTAGHHEPGITLILLCSCPYGRIRGQNGIAAINDWWNCWLMARPVLTQPDPAQPRRVLILTAAPAQLLDIAGTVEVLAQAGRLRAVEKGGRGEVGSFAPLYDIAVHIVPAPGMPNTSAGLDLRSSWSENEVLACTGLDTLVVVGGEGARRRASDPAIQELVLYLAPRSRRIVGVCTGAFILAEAGLLAGRRATTHWRWCAELGRRYPELRVDPEPIYIRDGSVWTSAGITAGMDLALALVEDDHGHALALSVARELVLFLRRPGDQKQFSAVLSAQTGTSERFGDLLAWMSENLHRELSVEALADRACLSPRQFARVFHEEIGVTPARMLERLRVEAARQHLENGRTGLAAVVAACGFGTEETMRRAFLRHVGAPPGDYRDRFRPGAPFRIPTTAAEEAYHP